MRFRVRASKPSQSTEVNSEDAASRQAKTVCRRSCGKGPTGDEFDPCWVRPAPVRCMGRAARGDGSDLKQYKPGDFAIEVAVPGQGSLRYTDSRCGSSELTVEQRSRGLEWLKQTLLLASLD